MVARLFVEVGPGNVSLLSDDRQKTHLLTLPTTAERCIEI